MEIRVKLQPFSVPNYVLAEPSAFMGKEGFNGVPKWELRDVDSQTLSDLCDQYRKDIFTKAGKADPRAKGVK